MLKLTKKTCIYLRNVLLWFVPFFVFILILFVAVYVLKGNLDKYTELLKIFIWPVTVLIGLFFFRKVVTYMFFSMDEFSFFGIKGELKNVQELINEKVEKKFSEEKRERETTEKMKAMEERLNNTSASDEENKKLVRDIYKLYKENQKESQDRIDGLTMENQSLRETLSKLTISETPISSLSAELGSGDKINDLTEAQPNTNE